VHQLEESLGLGGPFTKMGGGRRVSDEEKYFSGGGWGVASRFSQGGCGRGGQHGGVGCLEGGKSKIIAT